MKWISNPAEMCRFCLKFARTKRAVHNNLKLCTRSVCGHRQDPQIKKAVIYIWQNSAGDLSITWLLGFEGADTQTYRLHRPIACISVTENSSGSIEQGPSHPFTWKGKKIQLLNPATFFNSRHQKKSKEINNLKWLSSSESFRPNRPLWNSFLHFAVCLTTGP
jgi:hypothetical protein